MANGHTTPEHVHERSDVSVRLLRNFLIAMALGIALLMGGLTLFWRYLSATDPQQPSVSRWVGPRELPPEPRLQTAPETDMEGYLRNQRQQQQTYGWADQKAGVVRIPIERAMTILVDRRLPHRTQPPETGVQEGGAQNAATDPQ